MVLGIGELPNGYDVRKHGVYHPGRYYGADQRNWKDLKIGEFPNFLLSRSKNPIDWLRSVGRFYWRYNIKWMSAKKPTLVPLLQVFCLYGTWGYFTHYDEHQSHRQSKYH